MQTIPINNMSFTPLLINQIYNCKCAFCRDTCYVALFFHQESKLYSGVDKAEETAEEEKILKTSCQNVHISYVMKYNLLHTKQLYLSQVSTNHSHLHSLCLTRKLNRWHTYRLTSRLPFRPRPHQHCTRLPSPPVRPDL